MHEKWWGCKNGKWWWGDHNDIRFTLIRGPGQLKPFNIARVFQHDYISLFLCNTKFIFHLLHCNLVPPVHSCMLTTFTTTQLTRVTSWGIGNLRLNPSNSILISTFGCSESPLSFVKYFSFFIFFLILFTFQHECHARKNGNTGHLYFHKSHTLQCQNTNLKVYTGGTTDIKPCANNSKCSALALLQGQSM